MVKQGERELDSTLSLEGAMVQEPIGGPVLAAWGRYELLELLGKGGMGEVYKARDHRLDRTIAVKFILGTDPNLTMRFLREARAQARIDHPNVCRVYEVGEVDRRAYIAIQFVDGEPLDTAAARMSLEEKVALLRDVAVAIQEAHRLGIVHRDIKPANIMVERSEDERWVPVVMDFGLARELTTERGFTESGAVLGTPAYMSPEQARGDVHLVDRRSDVYSLGATLYELLTGRPPFPAASLAAALAAVIHDDPPPPRSLVSSLPVDLETIALKCLAKEPAQRYPSARALADDLVHYLDGEPLVGRRPSLWQRLRLRVRRQRALVMLGTWSLASIAVVVAFAARAWIISRSERAHAAERTVLAGRLGQDAKEIELFLRSAYLLPLHDTRRERARVRDRMRTIAATRHELGALGDAVVHDALGHGYLALHRWREAVDELTRAAELGLRTPALHAARGRALGELYHRLLENARRSGDKAWLARREHELDQQYLKPAIADLAQSRGSDEDAALLEALIALYRRDFVAAEKLASAAADRAPWLFELRKLAADAAYRAAVDTFDHGDYDAARPGLERAAALYAEASAEARSDASVYQAAAQTWLQLAEIDFRLGRSPREPLDHALDVIDRALLADPDDAPAHTTKAYVLLRWHDTPSLHGSSDRRPLLARVAQSAARAVEIDPLDARAWDALGNAHIARGTYETSRGEDGTPWWNRALDDIGRALAIEPNDPWANNDVGVVHRSLGASLEAAGRDPIPEYQAAIRSYERAIAIDPQYLFACTNQIDIQASIAEHDTANGRDPRAAVDEARRVGERCLAIDPTYYATLESMAQSQLALAHHLVEAGGVPGDALARAGGYLDRADSLHPGNMVTWFYRLLAAEIQARSRLREAADPTSAIAAGRAALREALRLAPGSALCHDQAARLGLVEAAWADRTGTRSAPLLTIALADAEKAIALDKRLARARLTAAEVCLQLATAQRSRSVIDRGIAHIDQALAIDPRLRRADTVRAALLQLRSP